MPRILSFQSETQRTNFEGARADHVRGGALARPCGARLRTGRICTQLALAGEARCLRHCGPDAAARFRERQIAGLRTGSVSPEAWVRAEARRARSALTWAWRKNPLLPGRTIDLGPDEAAFSASAAALGVDVYALYPAQADWLRWRWQRVQKDRPDDRLWLKVVREDLPRQRAAADAALAWVQLGITDLRSRQARAVKSAVRAGDLERAQAILAGLTGGAMADVDKRLDAAKTRDTEIAKPRTSPALSGPPWTPRTCGGKRRRPDRAKAPAPVPGPPKPLGRPRRRPYAPDELAAMGDLLRTSGPAVRAMFDAIPGQDDQLRFLRDLSAYANAPDDAGAQGRWLAWVRAVGLR